MAIAERVVKNINSRLRPMVFRVTVQAFEVAKKNLKFVNPVQGLLKMLNREV
jgi:hypothetical protein